MSHIKKDLSYQGTIADFTRVESYLEAKWCLWFLRNRLALSSVAYNIEMGPVRSAIKSAAESYEFL
jgi:hypothetical protein